MGTAMAGEQRSEHDPRGRVTDEALLGLEERLQRASEAAERLLADAVARVGDGLDTGGGADRGADRSADDGDAAGQTPPSGWQQPGGQRPRAGLLGEDGDLLLGLLASLRDRIPPDLQRRLAEAVREVLLALRALIDWYLERNERRRAEPTEVRDIPIL